MAARIAASVRPHVDTGPERCGADDLALAMVTNTSAAGEDEHCSHDDQDARRRTALVSYHLGYACSHKSHTLILGSLPLLDIDLTNYDQDEDEEVERIVEEVAA